MCFYTFHLERAAIVSIQHNMIKRLKLYNIYYTSFSFRLKSKSFSAFIRFTLRSAWESQKHLLKKLLLYPLDNNS